MAFIARNVHFNTQQPVYRRQMCRCSAEVGVSQVEQLKVSVRFPCQCMDDDMCMMRCAANAAKVVLHKH